MIPGSGPVLAVDTCGRLPGVALALDGRLSVESYLEDARPRAEYVAARIGRLFAERKLGADSLVCCGVTTGPGSYTGLRIGLALVRGLALPNRLPVVGMGSLELAARAVEPQPPSGSRLCVVLPAGRTRVYAAGFRVCGARAGGLFESLFDPVALEAEALCTRLQAAGGAWLLTGEGAATVVAGGGHPGSGLLVVECPARRAGVLAEAAADLYAHGFAKPAGQVLPLYVGGDRAVPNRNRVAVSTAGPRQGVTS